jgi:hypothetical protein
MARKLNREQIRQLAFDQCNDKEIAAVMNTTIKVIRKQFKKVIDEGRLQGQAHIKKLQMEKAEKGDPKMLQFMGKNYLGQKDQPQYLDDKKPLPLGEFLSALTKPEENK